MMHYAIIVAGGSGSRMKSDVPKQFHLLAGRPLLEHTIMAFEKAVEELHIILVVPKSHIAETHNLTGIINRTNRITITSGGATRFDSVKNGLRLVPGGSIVFVHDGVRCLVTPALINTCLTEALLKGNAIPAIASPDSMRLDNSIIDRNKVRLVQTPQTFQSTLLKRAYTQEYRESFTDDASVLESIGEKINLVEGEPTNIKITLPFDMKVAELILKERG